MTRIERLKKEIAKARGYLNDPGKRESAMEVIWALELRLNDRLNRVAA